MDKFSERLVALRKEKDLTQAEFARLCGKQRTTVSGYETEGKEPDFALLCQMADYFGVTTDYLLGREDERAHGNEAFRQDNANFKRRYDALSKELRAVVSSTFDSVYVLLSRCMNAQNAAELALYRELFSELQTGRGEIKSILADCGGDLAGAFQQIMEKQNTLKARTASTLDSLLQADVAALKDSNK